MGRWRDMVALAATLALLTYTYSIGRLLGPLLALGLVFFVRRARVWSVHTWGRLLLSLVPLFHFSNPQSGRVDGTLPRDQLPRAAEYCCGNRGFIKHYFGNINPWRFLINEHSNVSEIIHIPGAQPFCSQPLCLPPRVYTLPLRRRRLDAWWRFVIYGLAISIVPGIADERILSHAAPRRRAGIPDRPYYSGASDG